ncbi:nuclear transport factor 2 family protein [Sphaerimonospora thailandensis]|uniref:SnoaL-like domain-containing protein n=1 Tax=Sphaerimonospora thailandensis TaxID=795644 RepID=A0A8J3RCE1_9ACTN|nr:nuclear transport factor 2 family protein [Sphaerimonospora thailandensis]GIH72413.1 hypothetical protein Mth01_46660 [Sphaerimonospora thailandensis]
MATSTDSFGGEVLRELAVLRDELARLRCVADAHEITRLVMSYGPLVDAGDAEGTAQLWTESGRYEVDGVLGMQGREQIAQMVHSPMHQALIREGAGHVLTTPRISVQGDEAEAFNHALLIAHEAGIYRIARISANHWRFVRNGEGWRVVSRVNRPLDGREASRRLFAQIGDQS